MADPTQKNPKAPAMLHDGVTPDKEAELKAAKPASADAKPDDAAQATAPPPADAPASAVLDPGSPPIESRVITPAHQLAGAPKKPLIDLAGRYRVKGFRVRIGHEEAYRGALVQLSHDDALSLLRFKAIESEAEYEKRLLAEKTAELTAQMLAAQGEAPFASGGAGV